MPVYSKVVLVGALSVLAFDMIAALASRQFGFAYASASVGSWFIYGLVGYFAAQTGGGIPAAALAGAAMGLVDATAGWAISWAIGPGRLPAGTLTPGRWLASAIFVVLSGAALGALGGLVGKWTASSPRHSSTAA
jgi:hypothetical protein